VTDIFREVEEEVRRERLERIWKQYGDYIVAGVSAVVNAVAGYQFWLRYEASERLKASEQYDAAIQTSLMNPAAGAAQFGQLAASAPSGYALLAKFNEANAIFATGDRARAISLYKAIASSDKSVIGRAALIREAWGLADTASRGELESLLAPVADPSSPWHSAAAEILAHADYRAGNLAVASKEFEALANDHGAPVTLRTRARVMVSYIRSGAQSDFGTVPPPVASAKPNAATPSSSPQQGPSPQ
jgi:hypothetical protein